MRNKKPTVDDHKTVQYVKNFFNKNVLRTWPNSEIISNQNVIPGKLYKVDKKFTSSGDLTAILLFITGNRFCMRVNRHHKSNNIFFVVNVIEMSYHQRCLDPDCKWYCSPKYYIPRRI